MNAASVMSAIVIPRKILLGRELLGGFQSQNIRADNRSMPRGRDANCSAILRETSRFTDLASLSPQRHCKIRRSALLFFLLACFFHFFG